MENVAAFVAGSVLLIITLMPIGKKQEENLTRENHNLRWLT
jgi:hypothetical protein